MLLGTRISKTISSKIYAWQNTGAYAYVSGKSISEYGGGEGTIPDYSAILDHDITVMSPGFGIRQKCELKSFTAHIYSYTPLSIWQFKILRWSIPDNAFKCIASRNFQPTGITPEIKNFILSEPISVEEGDIPAIYFPKGNNRCLNNSDACYVGSFRSNPKPKVITGNIEIGDVNAFSTTAKSLWPVVGDSMLNINCYSNRPYCVLLGDSIVSGGNNDGDLLQKWNTDQENVNVFSTPGGQPGNINYSLGYRLSQKMPLNFRYQVISQSGSDFSRMLAKQAPKALLADPKIVIFHSGWNDLFAYNKTWNEIIISLEGIKNMFVGRELIFTDILPTASGNQTDLQCLLIRTFNSNLKEWCASNNFRFVPSHDEMGNIRYSTGFYDDLKPEYDSGDGLHLSLDGVDKLAEIISRYIY